MDRRVALLVPALMALLMVGCPNPLLDKVRSTVAQKDLAPNMILKAGTSLVAAGSTVTFGTISINTSKDVTFTIQNSGTAGLVLTDTPKVSIGGTDAALFTVVSEPASPVAPGGSTSFVMRFLPPTNGAKSATVTIPTNDSAARPFTFTVAGTGSIQAAMRLEQASVDIPPAGSYSYSQIVVGSSTANVTFTIKNIGTAPLNLTGAPYVSIPGSEFVVTSQPSTPIAAGGGSTTFTAHFSPSSEGNRSAVVTIANDDPDRASFTFTMKGVSSTVMLPATGQITKQYAGDNGWIEKGVAWPGSRFTVGASTITDTLTGLEWVKATNLMKGSYPGQDTDGTAGDGLVTWQHALDFVAYLNSGPVQYASRTDWRLPNRDELRSLANYEQSNVAAWLGTQNFGLTDLLTYYWTSSNYMDSTTPTGAWYLSSSTTFAVNWNSKTANYYGVWPVRTAGTGTVSLPKTGQTTTAATGDDGDLEKGIAWPATRFVNNGDGTITDNLTGLMWTKDGNLLQTTYPSQDPDGAPGVAGDGMVTWQHALDFAAYVNAASYLGHADWRVPNVNELESLLNAERTDNEAYLGSYGFTGIGNTTSYWTSTTVAATTSNAWAVFLGTGAVASTGTKSNPVRYVILVRSSP